MKWIWIYLFVGILTPNNWYGTIVIDPNRYILSNRDKSYAVRTLLHGLCETIFACRDVNWRKTDKNMIWKKKKRNRILCYATQTLCETIKNENKVLVYKFTALLVGYWIPDKCTVYSSNRTNRGTIEILDSWKTVENHFFTRPNVFSAIIPSRAARYYFTRRAGKRSFHVPMRKSACRS